MLPGRPELRCRSIEMWQLFRQQFCFPIMNLACGSCHSRSVWCTSRIQIQSSSSSGENGSCRCHVTTVNCSIPLRHEILAIVPRLFPLSEREEVWPVRLLKINNIVLLLCSLSLHNILLLWLAMHNLQEFLWAVWVPSLLAISQSTCRHQKT